MPKKKSPERAKTPKPKGPPPEPYVQITPEYKGFEINVSPFEEWSDQEINVEVWDIPKSKDKKAKDSTSTNEDDKEPELFIDPQINHMPIDLNIYNWKRASELFPDATHVIYQENDEYSDLLSDNKHILHCKWMRNFISSLGIMEYLSYERPFIPEGVSTQFTPNTFDGPWKPWHHIYSCCKAGKGQKHHPQPNKLGKYIVRLYWLGSWRKVYIDDFIPVDKGNHIVFPTIKLPKCCEPTDIDKMLSAKSNNNVVSALMTIKKEDKGKNSKTSKKKSSKTSSNTNIISKKAEEEFFILWPILLAKALLKVSSVSCLRKKDSFLGDFDVITSLTGWCLYNIDIKDLDLEKKWEVLTSYVDHYEWPMKEKSIKSENTAKTSGKGSKKSSAKGSKKSSTKGSKKGKKAPNFLDEDTSVPTHMVINVGRTLDLEEDLIPGITPCWDHRMLVDQTRDIPLLKPDPLPELERWKHFRWLNWAISNGYWPDIYAPPIQCLKIFSNMKHFGEHIVYAFPSEEALVIKNAVKLVETVAKEAQEKGKSKKSKKDSKKSDKDSKKSKSSKKSKNSKGSKKGKKGKNANVVKPSDPSMWLDFLKIANYIESVDIYMKPSKFAYHVRVTDIAFKNKPVENKQKSGVTEATFFYPGESIAFKFEEFPILFSDSIDTTFLLMNMSFVGDDSWFSVKSAAPNLPKLEVRDTCYDKNCPNIQHPVVPVKRLFKPAIELPFASMSLAKFSWLDFNFKYPSTYFQTTSTRATLEEVKEGRQTFFLLINSPKPYVLDIYSDSEIHVGLMEYIYEKMEEDSKVLIKHCHEISQLYGELVQSFGTSNFREKLHKFFHVLQPSVFFTWSKKIRHIVYTEYLKEFVSIALQAFPEQEWPEISLAFRVLFLNPSIRFGKIESAGLYTKSETTLCSCEMESEEVTVYDMKIQNCNATKIQSLFRMRLTKKLYEMHNPKHPNHLKIFEILKKVYTTIFNLDSRIKVCSQLIRKFVLFNTEMCKLAPYYTIYQEATNVINMTKFTGTMNLPHIEWVLLCKYIFFVNTPGSIVVKVHLFTDLEMFTLLVYDNSTGKALSHDYLDANSLTLRYTSNVNGYTALAYGWKNEKIKQAKWKLVFITVKEINESLLIIPEYNLMKSVFMDNYKPNAYNRLFKFLINVADTTWIHCHLFTSNPNVQLRLLFSDSRGRVLKIVEGGNSLIIPNLHLYVPEILSISSSTFPIVESSTTSRSIRKSKAAFINYSRSSKSSSKSVERKVVTAHQMAKRYVLEGYVMNNSWPLRRSEWRLVDSLREKDLYGNIKMVSTQNLERESTSRFVKELNAASLIDCENIQKPFWCIEIHHEEKDQLSICLDLFRTMQIKEMKASWYKGDPDRYRKSQKIRENFIKRSKIKVSNGSYEEFNYNDVLSIKERFINVDKVKSKRVNTSVTFKRTNIPSESAISLKSILKKQSSCISNMSDTSLLREIENIGANVESNDDCFLKNPISPYVYLPPFNLTKYYEKQINNETEKTHCTEDYFKQKQLEQNNRLEEWDKLKQFRRKQLEFINDDRFQRDVVINSWYDDLRTESKRLMERVYNKRDRYINKLIEAEKERKAKEALLKKSQSDQSKKKGHKKTSKGSKGSKK